MAGRRRVAAVTGASRGLGRAIALRLAADGIHVAALARSEAALAETVAAIEAAGGSAHAAVCDVTDEDSIAETLAGVVERAGGLDVLVNNAGLARTTPALEIDLEELQSTFALNVFAPTLVAAAAARLMSEAGGGAIVNVASTTGLIATPGILTYSASKAALIHLTRILALEWARHDITVNCVAPGYVPTELNSEAMEDERTLSGILRRVPLKRLGSAEEVAGAVAYLAGEEARYVTGTTLVLDGGMAAR